MHLYDGTPGWTFKSRTLALALTCLEDETGPEGHALSDELDDQVGTWYEADTLVNYAAAARERYMKKHGKNLEPGEFVIVRDTRPKD